MPNALPSPVAAVAYVAASPSRSLSEHGAGPVDVNP